ncbi:MAG TPA: 6-phosphogluconolactonase [Phycisphaerales bacterium]|nr:6-phosphogluconolactonase [Phycisphaerales bacterium]
MSAPSPRDIPLGGGTPVPVTPEAAPAVPALPGSVVVRDDAEDLHAAMGADLLLHALNCVRAFGDFHLALSGGSTPLPFYRRLMVDPMFRAMPWSRTHLWMVDERRVPFTDERSNYAHIRDYIVEHSDIPREQAHPMLAIEDRADELYEAELRETLGWREKGQDRLDYVLLGMGNDGHTASLFPNSPALLAPRERLVVVNAGPAVTPPDRVTMTYTLLNAARLIAVLVTGEGKRETIRRVAEGREPESKLPIRGIKPVGGVLRWYLDSDACPR